MTPPPLLLSPTPSSNSHRRGGPRDSVPSPSFCEAPCGSEMVGFPDGCCLPLRDERAVRRHGHQLHPLDVLKVGLQMQLMGKRGPLTGMGQKLANVVKKEEPSSLYLGLTPALTRSILYGGLRLGLYEPTKHFCELACGLTNVFVKLASGAFSGTIATALTKPVEVVKVMKSCKKMESGSYKHYE